MSKKLIKGGLAGLGSIFAYMSKDYIPLIWILIFSETGDYLTGIYSGWKNENLSSKAALEGFFKKILYFFLVAVGFMCDYMIYWITNSQIGIKFDYPAFFGVMCMCYLISTELISITENLNKIGIGVPFLTKALADIRKRLKDNMPLSDEENNNKEKGEK